MTTFKYQALVKLYPCGDADPYQQLGPSPRRVILRAASPQTHRMHVFCALVSCEDGAAFRRGSQNRLVTLRIADDEAEEYLRPGGDFEMWLGSDIGHGRVTRRLFVL